jgi:hypothetical protein
MVALLYMEEGSDSLGGTDLLYFERRMSAVIDCAILSLGLEFKE